jgi:hypothetical protein
VFLLFPAVLVRVRIVTTGPFRIEKVGLAARADEARQIAEDQGLIIAEIAGFMGEKAAPLLRRIAQAHGQSSVRPHGHRFRNSPRFAHAAHVADVIGSGLIARRKENAEAAVC